MSKEGMRNIHKSQYRVAMTDKEFMAIAFALRRNETTDHPIFGMTGIDSMIFS